LLNEGQVAQSQLIKERNADGCGVLKRGNFLVSVFFRVGQALATKSAE